MTCVFVLSLSLLGGCGLRGDALRRASVPPIQQSHAVLTSPPDIVTSSGIVADGDFMFSTDGSACVRVSAGDLTSTSQEVNVTASKVLWTGKWDVGGITYLIVSVVDASDGAFLYRYHDSTGDGLPDDSTETLLFSSGTVKMYITDLLWNGDEGSVHFLDRRCQDIQVAEDTDADGWPDAIRSTAFALSSGHPELLNVRSIHPAMGGVMGSTYAPGASGGLEDRGAKFTMYDVDENLVAEIFSADPGGMLAPVTWGTPYAGQVSVDLDGGLGADGLTAEIWELDANDEDVASLGSVVLGTDGKGTITLSRALIEDEVISVRFDGREGDQHLPTVISDRPQLVDLVYDDPIPLGANSTVTTEGLNLTLGMTVRVRDVAKDVVTDLPVATLVSSTEATVVMSTSVVTSTSTRGFQVWLLPGVVSSEASLPKFLPVDSSTVYSVASFVPASGAAGTAVVLTGSGFEERQIDGVCFGGVPAASFSVDSDTQITVAVPTGAVTGRITVIQLHNTIMSSSDFTTP